MTRIMSKVCFLWLVLPLMLTTVCCENLNWSDWADAVSSGVVGDSYYFVGDTFTLECTVSDDSQNASKLRFYRTVKDEASRHCVPQTYMHVTSSVSASLIIPQVNFSHSGVYTCYQDDRPCIDDRLDALDIIGVSDEIFIEYPPENVTNFQCVVFNWNEAMNCSWQHPKEYINWTNIKVTTGYASLSMVNQGPMTAYKCPHLDNNSCFWNRTDFFDTNYVIEVNVTNTVKNKTASQNFFVNISLIVKPDPVINLTALAEPNKPDCISLSWQHSRSHRDKIYRIKQIVVGYDNNKTEISETRLTVCGYAPHTHHNFSVACRPASGDGFWSEVEYVDVWTPMAAPNMGPSTWNGSFTTTNCVSDARNVTIMWQDVVESEKNGIIKGYSLCNNQLVENYSASEYLATIRLDCFSNSVLRLYAFNDAGSSQKPTVIFVPPISFSVPQSVKDSFAVELLSGNNQKSINATWDLGDTVVQNFTFAIVWCLASDTKNCEKNIQRQVVPPNQTFCELPISPYSARKYLFGVSVTSGSSGLSSGIFWTRCLYWQHPAQVQSVDSLNVQEEAESVRLSWAPYVCSYENQVRPSKIVVKWCEATEGTEPHCKDGAVVKERDVPPSNSFYTVSPLQAKAYLFTVQPVSQNIVGSEVQPWMKAVPLKKVAEKQYLWLLFLPLLVFAVILFYKVYKNCQGGRKRAKELQDTSQIIHRVIPPASQQQLNYNMPPENSALEVVVVPPGNRQSFLNPVLPNGSHGIQFSGSGHDLSDPGSNNSQAPLLRSHRSDPFTGQLCPDVLSQNADNTPETNRESSTTEEVSADTYLKQVPLSSDLTQNKRVQCVGYVQAIYEGNLEKKTFNNKVKFVPKIKSTSPAPENKIQFPVKQKEDDSHSLQAAATKPSSSNAKITMADSSDQVSDDASDLSGESPMTWSSSNLLSPLLAPNINSDISTRSSTPSETIFVDTQLIAAIVATSPSVLGDGVHDVCGVREAPSDAPASSGQETSSAGASNNQLNAAGTAYGDYMAISEI